MTRKAFLWIDKNFVDDFVGDFVMASSSISDFLTHFRLSLSRIEATSISINHGVRSRDIVARMIRHQTEKLNSKRFWKKILSSDEERSVEHWNRRLIRRFPRFVFSSLYYSLISFWLLTKVHSLNSSPTKSNHYPSRAAVRYKNLKLFLSFAFRIFQFFLFQCFML